MTRGQFKKLLLAVIIIIIAILGITSALNVVNYETPTSAYELFNKNITNKKVANEIVRFLREYLVGYEQFSPNIDFEVANQDTIIAQIAKRDYIEKLNNPENKQYLDILRKYFKLNVVHIYELKRDEKIETYGVIIGVDYVDIENNYKIYKNKQISNELDSKTDFITYMSKAENVLISKKYITNYTVTYDGVNQTYTYSDTGEILKLQIPLLNASDTIKNKLDSLVYDISLEPLEENKTIFNNAKIYADKDLEDVNSKNYANILKDASIRYSKEDLSSTIDYVNTFYKYYKNCDLVKFIEEESKIKFVGYDNVDKTLVYEIEEYPYEDVSKLFFLLDEGNTGNKVPAKVNMEKFTQFKKLLDNGEIKKNERVVEIPVDEEGRLKNSVISFYMPKTKLLWNKEEFDFNGLTSLDASAIPDDYKSYFTVQPVAGIANNAACVYALASNFDTPEKYENYITEKTTKALKIILGYDNDNATEYYKNVFDDFFNEKIAPTYIGAGSNFDSKETFDKTNSELRGVKVIINAKPDSFSMVVVCDNWEVSSEE